MWVRGGGLYFEGPPHNRSRQSLNPQGPEGFAFDPWQRIPVVIVGDGLSVEQYVAEVQGMHLNKA